MIFHFRSLSCWFTTKYLSFHCCKLKAIQTSSIDVQTTIDKGRITELDSFTLDRLSNLTSNKTSFKHQLYFTLIGHQEITSATCICQFSYVK